MVINLATGVGDLAASQPALIPILDSLGIDFCCGGQRSLADAARAAGQDPDSVLRALAAGRPEGADEPAVDWRQADLSTLVDHIVSRHHDYLRQALPRISDLMITVLRAHGENHPELAAVSRQFQALRNELSDHLLKEERVLFPLIQSMAATRSLDGNHCGSVTNPIGVMEFEHDNAGEALRNLRVWTGGYTPPADACPTYRALLRDLADLERDLHEHIHKENNILHPRAVALEASLLNAAAGR
ncbi:MAG: iron-sulfur cluster repair di-iron protein [Candidatus Krumholzibacteriia bacterium]